MTALVWNPAYKAVEKKIRGGDNLLLLIVPFIKLDAIRRLVSITDTSKGLKVVVRWLPEDLISGASDLEVYHFLKEYEIPLYFNNSIHLKLYIFESNRCFTGSANLTLSGLGYLADGNVEVGNFVDLGLGDWQRIYRLIELSRLVDEQVYTHFRNILENTPAIPRPMVKPLSLDAPKIYTIASLPATGSPILLEKAYFAQGSVSSPEDMRRIAHDLTIYRIGLDHNRESFRAALGRAFRNTPFVCDFVEYLKAHHSLRFGVVNAWIHDKCEDVPLPYRWEIKENTRILYDWLAHFFPEITWDVPGERSQVIYWNK